MRTISFPTETWVSEPSPSLFPGHRERTAKILYFPGASDAVKPVLLLGNPGVGKSRLFARLAEGKPGASKLPDCPLELQRARTAFSRTLDVVDSPGINDLAAISIKARAILRFLRTNPGTTVVQVADARHLGEALLMTFQLAELGCPMVLALNRMDELRLRGGQIALHRLSDLLGIPVVGTVATQNRGTATLIDALAEARPAYALELPRKIKSAGWRRDRACLARAREILAEVYTVKPQKTAPLAARLGFLARHPLQGLGLLLETAG